MPANNPSPFNKSQVEHYCCLISRHSSRNSNKYVELTPDGNFTGGGLLIVSPDEAGRPGGPGGPGGPGLPTYEFGFQGPGGPGSPRIGIPGFPGIP